MAKNNSPSLFISAKFKTNVDDFKVLLYEEVKRIHVQRFPFNDFLYDIVDEETEEEIE
jgi:GTPase